MKKLSNVRPFVENPCDYDKVMDSKIGHAVLEAEKGNLKPLKEMYISFAFNDDLLIQGSYKLLGWFFDLAPYCKKYLVNIKHIGWKEYKTPNKTCLYNIIGRHNVLEIIEK